MSQRWSSTLQILKPTITPNTYAMFVGHMKCSQEDEHMLVLEVPTAAFRDTMFKAMGQQLRDAV